MKVSKYGVGVERVKNIWGGGEVWLAVRFQKGKYETLKIRGSVNFINIEKMTFKTKLRKNY